MTVRRPLAVANWKLNGDLALVEQMSVALDKLDETTAEVVICPSYPFLAAFSSNSFAIGAQNMSQHECGAFTGEVSGSMLKALNVKYVILGHSERRAIFGETDETIALKFERAVGDGLKPILCVGETLQQRNDGNTQNVVATQIKAVIDKVGVSAFDNAVVAYEPVWAIGTGKTATAEMAQEVHCFIRKLISEYDQTVAKRLPILYGGSVKSSNSKALFAQDDIDGGLVGGASLNTDEFLAICQSV